MRVLITGICGFVGSEMARCLGQFVTGLQVFGIDNLIRPGSETNRLQLKRAGIRLVHGDVRCASDFESLPPVDWVIDASANPSVMAGVDGKTSSRQLVEHNLLGTVNILEYCRRHGAGLALISTSRVYSIAALSGIPVRVAGNRFDPDEAASFPHGFSRDGIGIDFSVQPPLSLYGASKLASEVMAREYGQTFSIPVIVDRCGVMAGATQFGTAEQGIFSYWIRAHASRRPMKYLGFDGSGFQVRDALHPRDLADLLARQMRSSSSGVWNVGGGRENSMSLAQLSEWCDQRFGAHAIERVREGRRWDAPWIVMDNRGVSGQFQWRPQVTLGMVLEEIARHHAEHPDFLELSQPL